MNEFTEKLRASIKGSYVIYIDAANLERSVQDMFVRPDDIPESLRHMQANTLCWSVDYQQFNAFFTSLGALQAIHFYTAAFSTPSHSKFMYFLRKGLRFHLITKPLKEYQDHTREVPHRKANFDVEIAVDATHSLDDFDTMILFSGDSDFEYLIKFLRGQSKVVLGFSRSGHVAKELPPALSHYFDIANFRSLFLKVKIKSEHPHDAKNPASFDTGSRS